MSVPDFHSIAQTQGPPSGWWWSMLASGPALLLLGLGLGCLLLIFYLGWRLTQVSAARRITVRERLVDDSGVAMVEFVLVTPVLLFLTLLLIQTMLVFTGLFYVQYSAFAGARAAIVHIPLESSEPHNTLASSESSSKYNAIRQSVMLAVMPVSGRENGSIPIGDSLVSGIASVYQSQGRPEPAWVDGMIEERLVYAMNHTDVMVERVTSGNNEQSVEFSSTEGVYAFAPKEAISVRVRHEFALTVPMASRVFAAVGESGSYTPASRDAESPGPPGQWTVISARAILNNEGINRRLPPAPEIPRRR